MSVFIAAIYVFAAHDTLGFFVIWIGGWLCSLVYSIFAPIHPSYRVSSRLSSITILKTADTASNQIEICKAASRLETELREKQSAEAETKARLDAIAARCK